jgi:DNA-binding XRE family transcriptional regulator
VGGRAPPLLKGIILKIYPTFMTLRENQLLSRAELARIAGVSTMTIARMESGHRCRPQMFRKVLLALNVRLDDPRVRGLVPRYARAPLRDIA